MTHALVDMTNQTYITAQGKYDEFEKSIALNQGIPITLLLDNAGHPKCESVKTIVAQRYCVLARLITKSHLE